MLCLFSKYDFIAGYIITAFGTKLVSISVVKQNTVVSDPNSFTNTVVATQPSFYYPSVASGVANKIHDNITQVAS